MEKRRIINDEKELLDHFLQRTITSIFEVPSQGRNNFLANKITLESEIDKYTATKITPVEKDHLFREMDKIIARIQDFSLVDLNDPTAFISEENHSPSKKEEVIASRYNIQVTASDLKRIQNGNWFNAKLVDFYAHYLNEKLSQRATHKQIALLPSMFFSLLNSQSQNNDINRKYQDIIELLIKKADELKKGEQNIFKLVDRLLFVANLTNTHWVIIEVQRDTGARRPVFNQGLKKDFFVTNEHKTKYLIILYDSLQNYVKPDENTTLKAMRTFLVYTLRRWGTKIDEDNFELLYAETAKQDKILESGAYVCKFLDLLYQKKEFYDSPLLGSIKSLDIEYCKNELKDLIETVGFRTFLPESIFSRF